jgi:MFS family permease
VSHFSFKAVLTGGVVDVVGSTAIAFTMAVVVAMQTDLTSVPPSEQARALTEATQNGSGLHRAGLLLGGLFSIVGGYVAARVAKRGEILNGALSAAACLLLGIWTLATGAIHLPLWQHLFFFALSPALGGFGGYLRLKQVGGRTHPQTPVRVA